MKPTIAAACLVLAGCQQQIDVTLFTSDIMTVAKDGTALDATAIIGINAGSEKSCNEHAETVRTALATGFSSVDFIGCRKDAFETFADYRVALPVIPADTTFTTAMALWVGGSAAGTGVALKPNTERLDAITKTLPSDFAYQLSGKPEPQVTVTLQNDLTGPAKVTVQGVFLDGEPFQLAHQIEVARRDEVRIAISDVGNAAMNNGGTMLFWLNP